MELAKMCIAKPVGKDYIILGQLLKMKNIAMLVDIEDNVKYYLRIERFVDWGLPYEYEDIEVDPLTITMPTDCYDCDNRMIYSKDKVKLYGKTYTVNFGEDGFIVENSERIFQLRDVAWDCRVIDDVE